MKTRSVELYFLHTLQNTPFEQTHATTTFGPALMDKGTTTTHSTRHRFPQMTFRGVSFSEPIIHQSLNASTAKISFLAYDVLRGLFHYELDMRLPDVLSDDTVHMMDMNVRLVAAHKMAQLVNSSTVLGSDTPTPRSGFGSGARGFVSACVLGSQGRRGVWIERQRGNMDRTVFGFSATQRTEQDSRPSPNAEEDEKQSSAFAIEGRRLHEVRNSYDLGGENWQKYSIWIC